MHQREMLRVENPSAAFFCVILHKFKSPIGDNGKLLHDFGLLKKKLSFVQMIFPAFLCKNPAKNRSDNLQKVFQVVNCIYQFCSCFASLYKQSALCVLIGVFVSESD